MSKIGRKAIALGNVKIDLQGQDVHYKGPKNSGVYSMPATLKVEIKDNALYVMPAQEVRTSETNMVWGLHRALLSNAITGANAGFEKQLIIDGLGFKASVAGSKVVFNLGYSHKIDFDLPKGVAMEVDKTGQKLTLKSSDRAMIGQVCSLIKALRPTEPYKGTGIRLSTEVIARKAGKTKAA
jgi:large subunit ribosomal protein L6